MSKTHHHLIGPFPAGGCAYCVMKAPRVEDIVGELRKIAMLLEAKELRAKKEATT